MQLFLNQGAVQTPKSYIGLLINLDLKKGLK